jgi:RimJ/RimL family protein N-acetyltransferase
LLGYGYWAVVPRKNGAFLGEIGFMEVLREISHSTEGVPETGWCFDLPYWGRLKLSF